MKVGLGPGSAQMFELFGAAGQNAHLLVSTGPGVREPQNRRVEIVIQ